MLKPTSRGETGKALDAIKSEDTRERALLELRKDMNAQSAGAPRDSLLKTWVHFHGAWFGHHSLDDEAQPFPLTVMKIYAVGAMLKSGGYRSPANYLSRAKEEHIVRGHLWTDELSLAVRKTTSSITRGVGPGRQSSPVDLSSMWQLELPWGAGPPGAPLGGRRPVVTGSFFCVREIELSLALRKHAVIDAVGQRVTWLLHSSKTDPKAIGKSRSWDCVCDKDFTKPCAYHALDDHCKLMDAKFSGWPDSDSLPLFPDVTGKAVDKAKVVLLIEHLVALLGCRVAERLYGRHSLRVSGAQWMAKSGVPLPLVQLMVRWSSNAIARYVADTPLETISEVYLRRKRIV